MNQPTKDSLIQLCEYLAMATELALKCEVSDHLVVDPKTIPLELAKVKCGFTNMKAPCSAFMAAQWDDVRQFAVANQSDLIETAKQIRMALAASWAALNTTRLCVQSLQAVMGDIPQTGQDLSLLPGAE